MQLPSEVFGIELFWWELIGGAIWGFVFVVLARRAFTIDDPPPEPFKWGDAPRRQVSFRERAFSHVGPMSLVAAFAVLVLRGLGVV